MHFVISREAILKPLQLVAGVVERRQTLAVLSNVLLSLDEDGVLAITGTDLEVELVGRVKLEGPHHGGEITVPGRKLLDICKALPEGAEIRISHEGDKVLIKSGRSRFSLTSISASDFPNTEEEEGSVEITLPQSELKSLLDGSAFAMAQQDVRYYLNGMLFELAPGHLRVVATDGHRLALQTLALQNSPDANLQVILPRKAVVELSRLLSADEGDISLSFGRSHVKARTGDMVFSSKLVDGKFPDYNRVLPRGGDKIVVGDRQELKEAFARSAILSNEKYRGIRMQLSADEARIMANNPEQEEAEVSVSVDYRGEDMEVGFNVSYLVDVLSALSSEKVQISLIDSNSSALLEPFGGNGQALYVVMPLRL